MRRVGLLLAVLLSGIVGYSGDTAPGQMMFVIPGQTFRISGGGLSLPVAGRDPALTATYERMRTLLESAFPDTYTGQFEDDVNHLVIVYRRPDPALDRRVRAEFPTTRVLFADARFARTQLNAFGRLVMHDRDYWRGRGITVEAVANGAVGEGVDVFVAPGAGPDTERLMNEHYGTVPIRVR